MDSEPKYVDFINETRFEIKKIDFDEIFQWFIKDGLFNNMDCCCLKLSTDKEIRSLNLKYRGLNAHTDVLSFHSEFKDSSFKGDIIINIEAAERQRADKTL